MTPEKINWEDYFINIAKEVATLSTINRKHVGAIIVRNKTILATGYNNSICELDHCDTEGHEIVHDQSLR